MKDITQEYLEQYFIQVTEWLGSYTGLLPIEDAIKYHKDEEWREVAYYEHNLSMEDDVDSCNIYHYNEDGEYAMWEDGLGQYGEEERVMVEVKINMLERWK